MAREAAKAVMNVSYEPGVMDTETRLAEEVAIVCRNYITESWGVAIDRAEVSADFELKRVESIFFLVEILDMVPSTEQLLPTQTHLADAKVPKGAGGSEEAQLPMKAKFSVDAFTIKDVVS